jgi:hypothetical protein
MEAGSSQASNYEANWRALERRRIEAVFTERSHRFEEDDAGPSGEFVTLLSKLFKRAVTEADEDDAVRDTAAAELVAVAQPAIRVLDAAHNDEERFSLRLFNAIVEAFEAGGWIVRRSPMRKRRRVVQSATSTGDEAGNEDVVEFALDDMVVLGRRDEMDLNHPPSDESNAMPPLSGHVNDSRQEGAESNTIKYVCYVGDTMYAIGLSRMVKMKGDEKRLSVIKGDSFPDHAFSIMKKKVGHLGGLSGTHALDDDGSGWSVHHLLAEIELKMEKSSYKTFNIQYATKRQRDGSQKAICGVNPQGSASIFGPLAQELSYVVGHALPGRVALGFDLPETVPFAVVAGRRSDKNMDSALHWVHGNVITPDECGGGFFFNVDAFDQFREGDGRHALAAYLDVVVSGLEAAENWLVRQASSTIALLPPKPLCGRYVNFGGKALDEVSLVYSPLSIGRSDRNEEIQPPADHVRTIKVTQGEIFGGELNLSVLQSSSPTSHEVTWCRGAFDAGTTQQVLVKGVSRACFGRLVGHEGLLWNHSDSLAFRSLLPCLSPSLHAVYTTDKKRGLVQIMPNLAADPENFEPLHPELCADGYRQRSMWMAFKKTGSRHSDPARRGARHSSRHKTGVQSHFEPLVEPQQGGNADH